MDRAASTDASTSVPDGGCGGAASSCLHQAADTLAAEVATGQRVVLCEGDAFMFATGSYVMLALQQRHPHCPRRVTPESRRSRRRRQRRTALALQQDQLPVMPCPEREDQLSDALELAAGQARVLALLKLGRRWHWVRQVLERRQLLASSLFAERVGWPDQTLEKAQDVPGGARPYFSLLLIRQSWPEVLP